MQVMVEPFDVAPVISAVTDTAVGLVQRNGNFFDVRCDDNVGVMYSDSTKLRQILLNLLSNASKFTQRGRITLEASRSADGETMTFVVRDTGPGMSADQVAQLFQAFTIIDAEATHRHGGTGLGLALSKKFCNMMGGDIEVQSTPGVGSAFIVRLPVAVPDITSGGFAAYARESVAESSVA
jgi:signal transduction histidine kinase